ncbi:hypothetical protein ACLBXO_15940 [Methylobacterium sp. C33D]
MAGSIDVGRGQRRDVPPVLIRAAQGLLGGMIVLVVPIALLVVPQSESVVVVGSPGSGTPDLARIVAAAGGTILSLGGRPSIVVARADGGGFARRLYGAGARLVLDGRLARYCGRSSGSADLTSRPGPGLGRPAP